jgi:hypothetical protein
MFQSHGAQSTTTSAGAEAHTSGDIAKAAAVASILTKASVHPVDTIKCRLQSTTSANAGGLRGFVDTWKGKWTVRHLYRGLGVKLAAYAPSQSMYMTTYAVTKREMAVLGASSTAGLLAATASASTVAAVLRVPIEVVKMRLQACVYRDARHALQCLRADGLRPLGRMFVPQVLVHDIPYGAVQWLSYERLQPRLRPHIDAYASNTSAASAGASALVSGGVAGCVAGALTTPMDVVKTATIVQSGRDRSVTALSIARSVYRTDGAWGFSRGLSARVVWISANTGLYLALFETFKEIIATRRVASRGLGTNMAVG